MIENQSIEAIKKFVTGEMDIKEFEPIAKNDEYILELVKSYAPLYKKKYSSIYETMQRESWNNIFGQCVIHEEFHWLLVRLGIKVNLTMSYIKKVQKWYEIIPSWLSDDACEWVDENIIDKLSDDLSDAQKKKIVKQKIKEIFRYEKRPPMWAQSGEWPQDEDGNFLTFVRQTEDGDLVTYTFRNDKTKEEVEVEEYY